MGPARKQERDREQKQKKGGLSEKTKVKTGETVKENETRTQDQMDERQKVCSYVIWGLELGQVPSAFLISMITV